MLQQDSQPIGPDIVQGLHGQSVLAIYGFSGKAAYDTFIANSEGDLRPYPVMKGYLSNHLANKDVETYIMILDAVGPVAESLDAAAFESVLDAQSKSKPHLVRDFQLTFIAASHAYSVEGQ